MNLVELHDKVNDRDWLGRLVREEWIRWATEQPSPKASWLVPYDELDESDKEADRRIGEQVATLCGVHYLLREVAKLRMELLSVQDRHITFLREANEKMAEISAAARRLSGRS